MKRYALIGKELSHSLSQQYFQQRHTDGSCTYELLSAHEQACRPEDFAAWLHLQLQSRHLVGFNVTTPFKQWSYALVDEADSACQAIGATNCVRVEWMSSTHYRLIGTNTDAPAFAQCITPHLTADLSEALILGSGGAAQAVAYALRQLGVSPFIVSRSPRSSAINYAEACRLSSRIRLIINATPVGMSPHVDQSPWPNPDLLTAAHICYDLIYNPSPTKFLRQAAARGATALDGLDMLRAQAELSYRFWGL